MLHTAYECLGHMSRTPLRALFAQYVMDCNWEWVLVVGLVVHASERTTLLATCQLNKPCKKYKLLMFQNFIDEMSFHAKV